MTKIEEVARAIYAANSWWRAVEDDDDGLGRYKDGHGGDRFRAVEWEQLSEEDRRDNLDSARAAIEAMRVPNEAMIESSYKAGEMKSCNSPEEAKALFRDVLWPAAVDAILKEKPE